MNSLFKLYALGGYLTNGGLFTPAFKNKNDIE